MFLEFLQELLEINESTASAVAFWGVFMLFSFGLIYLWSNLTLYPIWKPKHASLPLPSRMAGEPGFFLGHFVRLAPYLAQKSNPMFILPHNQIWSSEHGDKLKTIYVSFGPKYFPLIHLNITIDPVNVKHILKDKFDIYEKGELVRSVLSDLLGDGIFVSDGPTWYRQRKVASKIFTKTNFNSSMMNTFNLHANHLVSQLKKYSSLKKEFDIQEIFYETTMEAIMEIAFGYHIVENHERRKQFSASFDRAQALCVFRLIHAGYIWKFENFIAKLLNRTLGIEGSPASQKVDSTAQILLFNGVRNELNLMKDVEIVNKTAYDIIRARRAEEAQKGRSLSEDRTDILSLFMGLSGDDEQTDEQIRDMVVSFIIAGRDTTASTLTWLFYELSKNQSIESKIIEELVDNDLYELFGNDSELTYDSLRKDLPYTTAVIHETIRLHSPVPIDIKVSADDDILPSGEFIRKGQIVAFSPWAQARDPDIWGQDAAEFNPDRWLPPRCVVFPTFYEFPSFQAGPRICLGRDFAVLEAKSILVKVLSSGLRLRLKDPNHTPSIEFPTPVLKMKNGSIMRAETA